MAYLKVERKPSGNYLRILQSYRTSDGKPNSRVLHSLGKVEDYTSQQLRSMGIKLYQLGGGELQGQLQGDMVELGRYNYGYQQVYGTAMQHYGLKQLLERISRKSKLSFNLYDSVFLMLLERLQEPCSKLSNYHHQGEYLNLPLVSSHHLYRALDKLAAHSLQIQKQIFQTGRDLFNQQIDVVFYDVTTFYFDSEVEKEGELRQKGFGKDGKIGKTQILFGMLIDAHKNPIGYRIYKGDTFEGDTFQKAIADLKQEYQIEKIIVVADRGMLSKHNLGIVTQNGYEFIIGERLKALPQTLQKQLLDLSKYDKEWVYNDADGQSVVVRYTTLQVEGKTIIATHSAKRATKDKNDREKKLRTAQELLLQPSKINAKAQRFFLKNESKDTTQYTLDEDKIKKSEQFDGFLAISTNADGMAISQVLEQYKQLFKIEHSFRTFKSHLETRPMFHWTDTRIEGHICLCYMAFALQNFILQKLNKDKSTHTFSENILRQTLDKMQVSLIENNGEKSLLRSVQTPNQVNLQKILGLKALPALQAADGKI